jgi:N-acetylneuraminate synthase
MIIEKDVSQYITYSHEPISTALEKIINTKGRIIFVTNESGILEGLFTNGDFLRWVAKERIINTDQPVSKIINRDFIYASSKDNPETFKPFLDKILFVPIIDEKHRLVAVARRRKPGEGLKIENYSINEESPAFVIAEIGNNHNGNLETAKNLIDAAVKVGANSAKFQMRNLGSLYCNGGNPNDIKENLCSQYTLDLLSRFQLTKEEMFSAFDYCKEKAILPLCTPWDIESLKNLEEYGLPAYKVASADLTNHDLLMEIAKTGKPLICSTGMSTEQEIIESVKLISNLGTKFVLLLCNSTYPAPFRDINLNYLDRLKEIGDCPVGYSGHERGVNVAIAAVGRGAKIIEKHITLNRDLEGNDHKVSLLPEEFKVMIDGIRQVEQSLGTAKSRHMSQGEMINRVNLSKSLRINCDLKRDQTIKAEMIEVKSPGQGLQPNRKRALLGLKAKRDFKSGDLFYPSDLEGEKVCARNYCFSRPWGLPVRYHDFKTIIDQSNLDLLEFHLSYKDLEADITDFFDREYELGLVVHSPELFSGDHTLDLCSDDEQYRDQSIQELQRVVNITRELKAFFNKAKQPLIVTNVGGFTLDFPRHSEENQKYYDLLLRSLDRIDLEGVEIIPQTMPPFPWHFGGQRYHNLFVEGDEIEKFCKQNGYRICLDISHSKLASNHLNCSFKALISQIGPFIAHLHIADAKDLDGEGLQIGEGEIDFTALMADLNFAAPNASFIPEIWQGHENEGEGFWVALEKLEKAFQSPMH